MSKLNKKIVSILGREKGYWTKEIEDKGEFMNLVCETKDGEEYEILVNKNQITMIQDAPTSKAE